MNEIERRAKKIEEVLNNPNCKSRLDFISIVQNLKSPNNINFDDYYTLIHMTMYLYHQEFGLQKIIDNDLNKNNLKTKINFNIPQNTSFEEFENELYRFTKIKNDGAKTGYESDIWPTYYDIIRQIFGRDIHHWGSHYFTVYSRKITQDKNDNEEMGKIYLSISSKDLFKFAILLLSKCLENNKILDFSFKVFNVVATTETLDSVCIYFTKENFHKYIQIIQEIKEENPTIQFNAPNFLAYQYNEYIGVAKDASPGVSFGSYTYKFSESFTNLSREALLQAQNNAKNKHELAIKASRLIEEFLESNGIIKLCEETKKRFPIPLKKFSNPTEKTLEQIRLEQNILQYLNSIDIKEEYNTENIGVDEKTPRYNLDDYQQLNLRTLYIYHLNFGLQNIIKENAKMINFDVPRNINFEQFVVKLYNYKRLKNTGEFGIWYPPDIYKTQYDILETILWKHLNFYGQWAWITCEKLTKSEKTMSQDHIALSINNKDLYKFANLLLIKCTTNRRIPNFRFFVHNPKDNYRDRFHNIAIYFTKENLHEYIKIIYEIQREHPEIHFNKNTYLGYLYNEHIALGSDVIAGMHNYNIKQTTIIKTLLEKYPHKSKQEIAEESAKQILNSFQHLVSYGIDTLNMLNKEDTNPNNNRPKR